MQIAIIVIGIVITLYLGIKEKRKNEENINKLNLRINVNGIRGKSTATRLITGVLNEAGYKVVGKTTGTSPRMIYWNNKKEEVIVRNSAGANIKEQVHVIDKAVKVGAEALVCECMAVRPEYQDVYQNDIFKANITVIVNVLEDHLDVMGPTTDEIAMAFSNTIPYNGYLVVDNGPYVKYFTEECKKRNTKIVVADNSKIPEGLIEKFGYTIFEDNISLALAVAEILNIEPEMAFRGMLNANPDPGAATLSLIHILDKLNQRYGQDFICKEDIGLHIIKNCIFGVDTDNDALMILENELKKILKKELREMYKHKPLIRDDDLDEILDEEYRCV